MIEAEVRKANNIPVITRRFRDVARLAIDRLEHEQASEVDPEFETGV